MSPVDSVIDCLNQALHDDPVAMTRVMLSRSPCNEKLAEHPVVQVGLDPQHGLSVGALGIINGVLQAAGLEKIAMIVEESSLDENTGSIREFVLWKDCQENG